MGVPATEGRLLDNSDALICAALTRAAAAADGLPLLSARAAPGLFAATTAGKAAARRCQDEGLLAVLRSETRGKTRQDICAITEQGRAFLREQASPRAVLEVLAATLEARQRTLDDLAGGVRAAQEDLTRLRELVVETLARLDRDAPVAACHKNGCAAPRVEDVVRSQLAVWHARGALGDCPLPELYRRAAGHVPGLTIGQFQDGLRRLQQDEHIYLHPWTGPLYDLPEPALALLAGHEVAYYTSLREPPEGMP